jgi:hypothetical protein
MATSPSENLPQSPTPDQNRRQLILLGLLAVGILAIVILTIILSQRITTPPSSSATFQPGDTLMPSPSPSRTQTATMTVTLRATFTPKPSGTPTQSLTPTPTLQPTLFPSLTPAVPLEENDRYQLVDWTSALSRSTNQYP